MTIRDKHLKIELLRRAEELIRLGRTNYICHALDHTVDRSNQPIRKELALASAELKHYILGSLSPYHTYADWFRGNHSAFQPVYGEYNYRYGRLAWIDWMIACYEEDIANLKE